MRGQKFMLGAVSGVAVLSLAACGGVGGSSSGDESPAGSDEVGGSLRTMGFNLPDEIATVRVETFEETYPDVDLQVNEGGFDEQQFLTSVSTGNPSELVYLPRDLVGSYAARGALVPLDQCIAGGGIRMEDFRPAVLDEVTYEDTVYGIPEFYNTPVLILNNTVLREAGVDPADVDVADQEKLLEAVNSMTIINGGTIERVGIELRIPEIMPLYGVIDQNPFIAGADDFRLDTPETIATFERLKELQDAMGGHVAMRDFANSWDLFGEANPFAENQVGAMVIEQWYVNVLAETSPDVDITVLPIEDIDGNPVTWASGNAWAIPEGAGNQGAACEFMNVMTAPETWAAAAEARIDMRASEGKAFTGIYTANEAADDIVFNELYTVPDGENAKWGDAVEAVLTAQQDAWAIPANPIGAQFKAAWLEAANRTLGGQASAAEALAAAQASVDSALETAG